MKVPVRQFILLDVSVGESSCTRHILSTSRAVKLNGSRQLIIFDQKCGCELASSRPFKNIVIIRVIIIIAAIFSIAIMYF